MSACVSVRVCVYIQYTYVYVRKGQGGGSEPFRRHVEKSHTKRASVCPDLVKLPGHVLKGWHYGTAGVVFKRH